MGDRDALYINYLQAWGTVRAGGAPHRYEDAAVQAAIALGVYDAKSTANPPRSRGDVETSVKKLLEGSGLN